jgi:hypothetical protein
MTKRHNGFDSLNRPSCRTWMISGAAQMFNKPISREFCNLLERYGSPLKKFRRA